MGPINGTAGPLEQTRIRELRHERGWSLFDLAVRTQIHTNDLSALERGLRPLFPAWRRRLARAFRVPQRELLARRPQ
jgi:transcriptional regulator with XRE-family HTH domain